MSIEKYIQSLLFKHECVVVPGFGAFITNYVPAKPNMNETLVFPPKKQLTFNSSLSLNDGVLVSYIAREEQISQAEALTMVNNRVQQYRELLDKYGKFKIEELGLIYTQEGKLLFEPERSTNFLFESFGLESVVLPTVAKTPVVPIINHKKWYWAAAITVPLVGAMLWLSLEAENAISVANLNPFKTAKNVYEARVEPVKKAEETFVVEEEMMEAGLMSSIKLDDEAAEAIKIKNEVAEVMKTSRTASDANFHVIAGCFKSKENAEKFARKLFSNGYGEAGVMANNDWFRVTIASFAFQEDARKALGVVKKHHAKDAWLLKK